MSQPTTYFRAPAHELIQAARLHAGLTEDELGTRFGLGVDAYRDLEHDANEAYSNLSLAHLSMLAHLLGVQPNALVLPGDQRIQTDLSFEALSAALEQLHISRGESLDQFSSYVGWDVAEVLVDPEMLWNFNLDALQDCCRVVGFDWRRAIPSNMP
jgi:transcriptional regulator with XRE-family HTH domain